MGYIYLKIFQQYVPIALSLLPKCFYQVSYNQSLFMQMNYCTPIYHVLSICSQAAAYTT